MKNMWVLIDGVDNHRLSSEELKVIEKRFREGTFLGDEKVYDNIIQMKWDLYELLGIIDIDDVFGELRERTYKVIQYDYTLPFDGKFELYTGLNRRSAFNIARRLNDKKYKFECENDCEVCIDYLVTYTNEYGETFSVDYLN